MNAREYGHLAKEVQRVSPALRFKILSLGDPGVGKSCLIKRFCEARYVADYISTIGIDYGVKSAVIDGHELKINFWDIAGDDFYRDVRSEFYKDTLGAILVFDTSQGKTFDSLDKWVDELKKLSGASPPIVLVANKLDVGPRVVSSDEGKAFADKHSMMYFETSANTGKNVKEMFEVIRDKKNKSKLAKEATSPTAPRKIEKA